jgi:hypothetical protein
MHIIINSIEGGISLHKHAMSDKKTLKKTKRAGRKGSKIPLISTEHKKSML